MQKAMNYPSLLSSSSSIMEVGLLLLLAGECVERVERIRKLLPPVSREPPVGGQWVVSCACFSVPTRQQGMWTCS